jgi:hypothetical protein
MFLPKVQRSRLAFLRDIDEKVAIGNVIVIDPETGKTLADVRICPTVPDEMYDVTYIDVIEWLTEDKISASGSINPSTDQAFVYDIKTGKELMDYPDDAGGGGGLFSERRALLHSEWHATLLARVR